jgi:hypothetical protein
MLPPLIPLNRRTEALSTKNGLSIVSVIGSSSLRDELPNVFYAVLLFRMTFTSKYDEASR